MINSFISEEKIKYIPKTKTTSIYKVILKEFSVLDKIDINGSNITIKDLEKYFKKHTCFS